MADPNLDGARAALAVCDGPMGLVGTGHLRAALAEVDRLAARVAELEEERRWRPASERPPVGERVEVVVAGASALGRAFPHPRTVGCWGPAVSGTRRWWVGDNQDPADDADVFGWRPLGPGPEVTGG